MGPDEYVRRFFAAEDDCLREVRGRADQAGLPQIQLPPATARAVQVLLRAVGAKRVLEVGALAGYSAVWIARALPPEGRLITLEIDPKHAALARQSLEAAGVADRAEVRVGDAATAMAELGPLGSFDAVFLDADKERYAQYAEEAARLLRSGGLLLADNALWKGRVAELEAVGDLELGPEAAAGDLGADAEEAAGEVASDLGADAEEDAGEVASDLGAAAGGPADMVPAADREATSADAEALDAERAKIMHAFNRKLAGDSRFDATVLPVGDGLAVAVKR